MRFSLAICSLLLATVAVADETYVAAGGALMLPQGAGRMRRVGGGAVRAGRYFGDFFAVEGETAWLEDVAGLAADAVWHWQGFQLYGDFFGYSRFDPFFTAGARGWIGRNCGQVGPKAGVGAFYHLTDDWALRFDADATIGLDTEVEVDYTLGVGIQYSF